MCKKEGVYKINILIEKCKLCFCRGRFVGPTIMAMLIMIIWIYLLGSVHSFVVDFFCFSRCISKVVITSIAVYHMHSVIPF